MQKEKGRYQFKGNMKCQFNIFASMNIPKLNKRVAIAALMIPLTIGIVLWLFSDAMLAVMLKNVSAKLNNKYGISLGYSNAQYSFPATVSISNLNLQNKTGDTILTAKTVSARFYITQLLMLRIVPSSIECGTIYFTINDTSAADTSIITTERSSNSAPTNRNFLSYTNNLLNNLKRYTNTRLHFSDFHLNFAGPKFNLQYTIPNLSYSNQQLKGSVINDTKNDTLSFSGGYSSENEKIRITASYPYHTKEKEDREDEFNFHFDSLSATLSTASSKSNLKFTGELNIQNLSLSHWRISDKQVAFKKLQTIASITIDEQSVTLDSNSVVRLNAINIHPFVHYDYGSTKTLVFNVSMPKTDADTFFTSLPQGMFNSLNGIKCSGEVSYQLQLTYPTNMLDSLQFDAKLSQHNFRVLQMGEEDFTRINQPFEYAAYDREQFVRNIHMGTENPMFTPLYAINQNLVNAVLQSEDPSFMRHNGFIMEAFRESIIKNIREKRFARGGSTISMQLVKNVFLNRNKNIARKIEEALIVYIIEQERLVSKERMLEVYLNAIEWGPNVYGITEAAKFYFNRKPAELNLQQSIFLAGLIPAPKYYKYQFDKTGLLRGYVYDYINLIAKRMVSRGIIAESDTIGVSSPLTLSGMASKAVTPEIIETELP